MYFSTGPLNSGDESDNRRAVGGLEIDYNDILPEKTQLQLQGVDPRKGWNFRGVHRVRAWYCKQKRVETNNDHRSFDFV